MQSLSLLLCSIAWSQGWWCRQKFFFCGEEFSLCCFFVILDKFGNCSFYLYEELGWNFDGYFIESIDCFRQDGHFYYISPANPRAWKIFPSSERSSSISFLRDLKFLSYRSFTCLVRVTPGYFKLFVTSVKGVISPISFSACLSFEYRQAIDMLK